MPSLRPLDILLVEDDAADALLTKRLIQKAGHSATISVVGDGVEAMEFLRRESPFETASRPDIILLDLNLPRKDGREALAEIKSDESLKSIPVVVLSTSESETDVAEIYALHACGYLSKPSNLTDFGKSIDSLLNYWLQAVELPEKQSTGADVNVRFSC